MDEEKYTFRVQIGENSSSELINGIWASESFGRVVYSSIGNFIG
jgi:hypothetical protein